MTYDFEKRFSTEGFKEINLKDFKVRQLLTEKLQSPINWIENQDAIVDKVVLEKNLIKLFPESDWQPFLGHYVAVEINEDFLNKIREISKGPFNPEPPPPKTENYFKGENLVNLINLINDTAKDVNKSDLFFVTNIDDYYNLIEYQRIEQTKEVYFVNKRDVLKTGLYATINQSPIYVNKKIGAGNLSYGLGNFNKEKITHLNYLQIK